MALIEQRDTILENSTGKAYVGVRVQAYLGGIEQQLYADEEGQFPVSLVQTNGNGQYSFWISEGRYDLSFSLNGIPLGNDEYTLFYPARSAALGVSPDASSMGAFSGSIIPDNLSAKDALQTLENSASAQIDVMNKRGLRSAFEFIPDQYIGDIINGTSTVPVQSYLQQGLNEVGRLWLPPGSYFITGPIVGTQNGQALVGSGRTLTELRVSGDAFAAVSCTTLTDFVVEDLTINRQTGGITGGSCAIRFTDSHTVTARSLSIIGRFDIQIDLRGSLPPTAENPTPANNQFIYFLNELSLEAQSRKAMAVGEVGGVVQELYMDNILIVGGSIAGLRLKNCSGVYPGAISILGGQTALLVDPSTGQVVRYIRGGNILADSTIGPSILLDASGGGVIETWDTILWGASSSTDHGFVANQGSGTINGLKLSITATNSYKSGVYIDGGTRYDLEPQVGRNSKQGSALYPNIELKNVQDAYLSGYASEIGSSDFPELASNAVRIDSDCQYIHLVDLGCEGTVGAPIVDNVPSGPGSTLIRDCAGVKTRVVVPVTIPVGATSSGPVAHELSFTPNFNTDFVGILPRTLLANSGINGMPVKGGADATNISLVCSPAISAVDLTCDVVLEVKTGI